MDYNVIHNLECAAGMQQHIADDSIDLVVTSPPYDGLRKYNGYSFNFEGVAKELWRVIKPGGVVVWIVGDATVKGSETGTSFRQALYFKELGFNLHDTMIYQKNSYPFPPINRYYQQFEYMFILSKGSPNTHNLLHCESGGRKRQSTVRKKDGSTEGMKYKTGHETRILDNVWKIDTGYMRTTKDKNAFQHPAMFPEKLAEDHILSWSNPNDVVLDPFMGSGTTAKMATLNDRLYIGFEVSEEYCAIAKERLKNLQLNLMK